MTVGSSATFSAVVLNQGNAAAGAFRVSFYLASSTNIAGGTNIGSCTISSLAAGASENCSGPLTVSLAAGTYYGGAIADDQSQVAESNESNNTLVASNTLTLSNASPSVTTICHFT